jgi:hypothetical protein
VIVYFVDIGGIGEHHWLSFLFTIIKTRVGVSARQFDAI